MKSLSLLPRPRILLREHGDGPALGASVPESALGVAEALRADPTGGRLGIRIQTCPLHELASRAGVQIPEDFSAEEGYGLRIDGRAALIGAENARGTHNAFQTLAQIIAGSEEGRLPRLLCLDWPRLGTRGFTLCYHMVTDSMPLMAPNYETALLMIDIFAHLKMNTLLLELEAMFPYRGHPRIASRIAFTPQQIAGLRAACAERHVQVVPLVQSIGHAYAVLRHPDYAHLRELADTSQQYCLCNPDVPRFFAQLADEVIDAFGATRFHIGGDESRRLGQCPRCRAKAAADGIGGLYAEHVNAIARHLRGRGVTPMVWGDIMEDHPDILSRLDPDIEVIYWNYDMVDWNRPYVLEMYARSGRTTYTGSGARFGPHGDATFLFQKAMRNNALLAEETVRTGMAGMIVTDWTKLAPAEVGMIATAYGAESAWGGAGEEAEFCDRYARILFGAAVPRLDEMMRDVSESVLRRKDILNPHWAPPFVDQIPHYMPDWLDRMDWSGWTFSQVLSQYTQQEMLPKAEAQMRAGLARAAEALAIADAALPTLRFQQRLFSVMRLAALNQQVKCAMGLALCAAAKLLKYPGPDDTAARGASAAELRAARLAWEGARDETRRVLLPGTFAPSLEQAMRYKFDPAAGHYMERFEQLLEQGAPLHGLLDMTSW